MTTATRKDRPALGTLEPGQDVIVKLSPNDSRRKAPEDCYIAARVRKAARVWVELERVGDGYPREWRMRRDVQHEGSTYSGSNASFATLDQHQWDITRQWANGVLREAGIDLRSDSPWRGREIELADLLSKAAGS
jgi:hypothetical protein